MYSRDDDLLIAAALTRFAVDFEDTDPEFAEPAWQLAADRLLEHDADTEETLER
ncbi:hypothetical protein ACFQGT_11840 [Natrialbaceae archaeon GCM10025810]|uniref:hypothetical protein n=1 Tax=Halovalidus salilacus TaxID=3075124 RepID=UPI0036177DC8